MKMKKYIIAFCSLALIGTVQAGNPQRAGSAGASELLINPFARSAGWGGVNVAGVSGVDASFMNIFAEQQIAQQWVGEYLRLLQ